jgi:hypothetical protein
MPLYICRWRSGSFSVVSAQNRKQAVELLDEVGNADLAELFSVKNFLVTFRLKQKPSGPDDVLPFEFQGFGEQTFDVLCNRVYPVYDRAASEVAEHRPEEAAALQILNDALITERNRFGGQKPRVMSEDQDVAALQMRADVPKSVAEQIVKEGRRKRIEETAKMTPTTDKIQ